MTLNTRLLIRVNWAESKTIFDQFFNNCNADHYWIETSIWNHFENNQQIILLGKSSAIKRLVFDDFTLIIDWFWITRKYLRIIGHRSTSRILEFFLYCTPYSKGFPKSLFSLEIHAYSFSLVKRNRHRTIMYYWTKTIFGLIRFEKTQENSNRSFCTSTYHQISQLFVYRNLKQLFNILYVT